MKQSALEYFHNMDLPLLKGLIILTLYIISAKIASLLTGKILKKLTGLTRSNIDDKIIEIIHRPVFFTVLFIGIIHAFSFLDLASDLTFYINGSIFTLLAIIWCICMIRISNLLIESTIKKVSDITGLSRELTPLIENVWRILLIITGGMVVLSIWEINITPLLASAGIAGVAIALAAKDTLANFFGGISIFIDKPYKIGDYIVLDQGERGEVTNIGIRSTRIKTRDDILISIPNAIIANTKIINESAPVPNFRVRMPVSVAYGSDIKMVEKVLLGIAADNNNIQSSPEPRVRLRTLGDSGLNYELLCWAKEPAVRGRTIHEINSAIYTRFNEAGLTIPFPQRTIHLREEKI